MKNGYKILAFTLLGVIILSTLPTFVSAQVEWTSKISQGFSSFFTSWTEGQIGANVAKIFFFVIISLLIMLALGSLFSGWNQTVVLIISALVGFLATAYITPAEVYSLLTSYTALGLTIATLIPILVLVGLTYRAATSGIASLILLQKFAWLLFGAYLGYKIITLFIAGEGSGVVTIIVGVAALAAIVMNLMNKTIIKWIMKAKLEALKEAGESKTEGAAAAISLLNEYLEKIGGG